MAKNKNLAQYFVLLPQRAIQWGVPVEELLHRAALGKLLVGIRDFGSAHLAPLPTGVVPPDNYDGDSMACLRQREPFG